MRNTSFLSNACGNLHNQTLGTESTWFQCQKGMLTRIIFGLGWVEQVLPRIDKETVTGTARFSTVKGSHEGIPLLLLALHFGVHQ